jgi:hypothetical protein
MRLRRESLWECQKNGETLRCLWLRLRAQAIAAAAGDPDYKTRLNQMERKMKANSTNRKLSMITKGRRGALNMIQTPTHDWFLCTATNELFHYDMGVFEAYPPVLSTTNLFHSHHKLKVLPTQITAVKVERDATGSYWTITETLPLPSPLWQDATDSEDIEEKLLRQNERHLQQTAREEGPSTLPPFTTLRENHGFNAFSAQVLAGTHSQDLEISLDAAAFLTALKRTDTETALWPVLGPITSLEFQKMFATAKERTLSDSRTLNYTLWKCLAKSDKISGFACVLLSLPFTYGFVNDHWMHMTDFMLEKKPGVREIHMLRIIGKVAAEFNTCLKFYIGKQARDNFEDSNPCDEQHGFRPHRSPIDAMMLKLLSFEAARMQKCTVGSIQHDMTVHFDRMYLEVTNVLATKYAVDDRILLSISKTISRLKRSVETSMGVSKNFYSQDTSTHRLGGMVQGKADVPLATQEETRLK